MQSKRIPKEAQAQIKSYDRAVSVQRKWRHILPEHRKELLLHILRNALPIELEELEGLIQAEKDERKQQQLIYGLAQTVADQITGGSQVDRLNALLDQSAEEPPQD